MTNNDIEPKLKKTNWVAKEFYFFELTKFILKKLSLTT
jgi:hypothetical protein